MKYGYKERLEVVRIVKRGVPIRDVSKLRHIDTSEIQTWLRLYDRYGRSGLKKGRNFRATSAKREELVRMIMEKGVPLSNVSIENRVSATALKQWVRVVRENGYEALRTINKRGRPPMEAMGRPKKKEPQTEVERLQAELLCVRAENALLKKVIALVEEKKARARQNGQKPSTN